MNNNDTKSIYYYTVAAKDFGAWVIAATDADNNEAEEIVNIVAAREYEIEPFFELPEFQYTGSCSLIRDADKQWRIKFFTSGNLLFNKLNSAQYVDIFCVGGGGGAASGSGGAGGGGYTTTSRKIPLQTNTTYVLTIGAGGSANNTGGRTSFANLVSANGGVGANTAKGNPGGSGGGSW
jgi:hypothetical protein